MKKDLISKEIIKELVKDIAKYILNLDISNKRIEFLDKELKRIEKREADIIANVENEFILHIEIQNQNDKLMSYRMLRYYNDILFTLVNSKKDMPIFQYVIYIGKAKANFTTEIKRDKINYSYNLIDMKKIDCNLFLNQNKPEALVLAILCDFKDKNPKEVIGFIIDKLIKYSKNIDEFRNYMLMLETLSENRNLKEFIKEEEMLREVQIEKLPSFQIGLEKGMLLGKEKGKIEGKIEILTELGFSKEEIAKKLNISNKKIEKILKK